MHWWALTAASTRDFISIQSRDYNIREIVTYQVAGSNWGVLSASQYGGAFNEDLRCKRPDGSAALTAGVPAHVRVQCTGSTVEVWIDGVLCGTVPYALGLEVSCIGDSTQHPSAEFVGKMDECRVTFGLRNTGAFPPTTPHPTSAVPTGTYWPTARFRRCRQTQGAMPPTWCNWWLPGRLHDGERCRCLPACASIRG